MMCVLCCWVWCRGVVVCELCRGCVVLCDMIVWCVGVCRCGCVRSAVCDVCRLVFSVVRVRKRCVW